MINNYEQLSIGKYLACVAVLADESRDELSRQVGLIAILYDVDEQTVLEMGLPEYRAMVAATAWLGENPPKADGARVARRYRLGGGWELIPCLDVDRMTVAQYVDFQNYAREAESHLVDLLSVFLVPRGREYGKGYDLAELKRVISEGLSVVAANNLVSFFLTRSVALIRGMLTYSDWAAKRIRDEEKRAEMEREIQIARSAAAKIPSLCSGDGSGAWMPFPRPADAVGMWSGR